MANDDAVRELVQVATAFKEHYGADAAFVIHEMSRIGLTPAQVVAALKAVMGQNGNGHKPSAAPGGFITLERVGEFFGSVEWEWPGYVPKGHLTLVAGDSGIGKSYLLAGLIAAHLGYRAYPDGHRAETPGKRVVLIETEEMRGAYYERLKAMGVPGDAIVLPSPDGEPTYLPTLTGDAGLIEQVARDAEATMVVVDSLSGGHAIDENSSEMRGLLQLLAGMASRLKVPFLVAHHPRKRQAFEPPAMTLERVRGSSAIVQFCRSVIGLWRPDPNNKAVRAEVLKASFCEQPAPFGYVLGNNGLTYVEPPQEPRQETALDRAVEFLRAKLRAKPMRFADLLEEAEAQGISKNTLYRAKDALRIVASRGEWALPADVPLDWPQDAD